MSDEAITEVEDAPAVFRGASRRRAAWSLGGLAGAYAGGYAVLWALGLVVRGWRGWALLVGPLVILAASRLWSWRRVSASVEAGRLRYEGSNPEDDFEVELTRVAQVYFDETLTGAPLAIALDDRDERVLRELGEAASRRLYDHLLARGVEPLAGR